VGTQLAGCYCLKEVLGEGGMGRVYLGEDVRLRRKVAIKVMIPCAEGQERALRRFQREARSIAALGHQHIVTVFDVGELGDGSFYLVMEYLEGETLLERLKRCRPLPLPTAARIVEQTARALGAAHRTGLIHRDLKPENIVLIERDDQDDFVKVLDFGLAKPFATTGEVGDLETQVTRTGFAVGTPTYMSPEQARGLEQDHRSDVYALGMVTYTMVCGRPAFIGQSTAVLVSQAVDPPPPPRERRRELPPEAEAVLLRCLKKHPKRRYASAEEFSDAFSAALGRQAAPAPSPEAPACTPGADSGETVGARPGSVSPAAEPSGDLPTPRTTLTGAAVSVSSDARQAVGSGGWQRTGAIAAVVAVVVLGGGAALSLRGGGDERRPERVVSSTADRGARVPIVPPAATPAPVTKSEAQAPPASKPEPAKAEAAPAPEPKVKARPKPKKRPKVKRKRRRIRPAKSRAASKSAPEAEPKVRTTRL